MCNVILLFCIKFIRRSNMPQHNPVIIIPGIGQSKTELIDSSGNKIKNAWPVDIDMKSALDDLKGSLMKMMLFRKDAGFSDKVAKIVRSAVDPLRVGTNGQPVNRLRVSSYPQPLGECSQENKRFIYKMIPLEELGKAIGEENLFYFAYNPFSEVYTVAQELNDFVSLVKEKTGSEKTDFIAVSLGGAILKAYLDLYADRNDIGSIACVCAALDGTEFAADIFDDALDLENPAKYLSYAGDKAAQVAPMLSMIPSDVVDACINKSLDEAKNALLYNSTMMWACIPNSRFDAAADKYLSSLDTAVRENIKRFHTYSLSFADKLKQLKASGVRFCIVSGFGKKGLPVFRSADVSSDTVINASSSSLGATVKNINGETLPSYNDIDPSTAALPENTWFFMGQGHNSAAYNDVILSLVTKFITGEINDISSLSGYPQFNLTRNIKKLKYDLIPKANRVLNDPAADEALKDKFRKLRDEYYALLASTVIKDAPSAAELEEKYSSLLSEQKD